MEILIPPIIIWVALPSIQEDLEASSAQLVWIVSGYVLSFAVLLITGGRLGDRYGRKTIFNIGVFGFTLASVGCAFAQTADEIVSKLKAKLVSVKDYEAVGKLKTDVAFLKIPISKINRPLSPIFSMLSLLFILQFSNVLQLR